MSDTNPAPAPARRLFSLDVLRGLTIAFMIMVNNNGGHAAWAAMHHAEWNGLTPTDLVFPTFLFVVGVSIVFAYEARLAKGATRLQLARHTVQRAGILILLGIVVNSWPRFEIDHMRFYGVLQRIGLCYLIVGLFYLWDRRVWTKIAALGAVLLGYWVLVRWVPVPGAGIPGQDIPFLDKDMNLVAWLDRQVMPYHLYEEFTTHNARDPEGLLSTLPALGTALLGLLTALWLRTERSVKTKAAGLAGGMAACLAVGYTWSIWFPLNKKMWTSSYALVAAGWSLAAFALCYFLIEVRGWGKEGWTRRLAWPWLVLGSNAITAYMISDLIPGTVGVAQWQENGQPMSGLRWLRAHFFQAVIPDPGWAAFAYSVSFLLVCFVPVWLMYRKKIFLKV